MTLAAATLALPAAAEAAFPAGGNGKIVFFRAAGSEADIWIMNANGTGERNLTNTASTAEITPSFSPNARSIAIARLDGAIRQIAVLNRAGVAGPDLTSFPDSNRPLRPMFSPRNGERILFSTDGGDGTPNDIYAMNADGSGLANLTQTAYPPDEEIDPSYSPDGRRIVWAHCDETSCQIFVSRPNATGARRLTNPPTGQVELRPSFSPDGKSILFARFDIFSGQTDLWMMRADGKKLRNLTKTPSIHEASPAFSGDGRRIVFVLSPDGSDQELWSMRLNGTGKKRLTDPSGGAVDSSPHWETIYRCGGGRATIVGSDGPDKLRGTPGPDVIVANAGRDRIIGTRGNDRICGGRGNDVLIGGRGRDRLFGGPGNDRLIGGPGRPDRCIGGPGRDRGRGCERGRL